MQKFKQIWADLKNITLGSIPVLKERLKDKRVFLPLILLVMLIIYLWWENAYKFVSKRITAPIVSWANFSLEYRKVPFDTKSLDISFSTDLKQESINPKSITLSPFIEWKISLKSGNTVSYELSKNLEIWQEYALTVSKDIQSMYWRAIWEDYTIIFEAISWAKVTKILPENTLNDISQNAIIFFNIPMIALTSLDNKDKLPCPVEISPKLEWKCKWTGWNVLEFIPKDSWQWATQYKISVKATDWLLYPLKETKEITFKTPDLQFFTDETFSPKNWIFFRSNFPIDSKSVEKSFELKEWELRIPVSLKPVEWSETRYVIWPSSWNFLYWKNYSLTIPIWLSSKYWNLPTKLPVVKSLKSINFLSSTEVLMNEYSDTWVLVDTPSFSDKSKVPNKNLLFKMYFDDTVALDKNLFSITDSKWKTFWFELKYWTDIEWFDKTGKPIEKENKKIVLLTLKENLLQNTRYSLTILKRSNPHMPKDEVMDFTTAPEFRLTSFDYKDNSLGCAYFSNDLLWQTWESWGDYYEYMYGNKTDTNQNAVITTPKAIFRWITKDREAYDTKATTCPKKDWKLWYLVNFRLETFKDYEVKFQGTIKDAYGNKLQKDYTYKVKSWDIKQEDKYVYSSFQKQYNVFPKDVPNIINIQGVNLDKLDVEICEMDAIWYVDYAARHYEQWFLPICSKRTVKTVNLINKNWHLSNNKFDIEKDIMWGAIASPIYIISSKLWDYSRWTDSKWFEHVIIRSNLSLTYEDAKNKQLLFASALDGKEIPSNLNVVAYKYDNNSKKVSEDKNVKISWNAPKKTFEMTWWWYAAIVAKNDKHFWVVNTFIDQTSNYDFKYISWLDSSLKDLLYVYTERPLYKPGETVFFKWILRSFNFEGYKRSDIKKWKMKIADENYTFFKDVDVTIDKNSNFAWKFELPKEMKLWKYMISFLPEWRQDEIQAWEWIFYVEEYKNPVFKVNITWDKKEAVLWDSIELKFNWEYYFWWKLTSWHYYKWILTQNYFFDAKNYSDFQFWTTYESFECLYWGYCNYEDNMTSEWEWDIKPGSDETWNYKFPTETTDDNKQSAWEKIYSFNVTIEDPDTKKQITNSYETILHNTDAYVWVKVPYYSKQQDWIKFSWIVLNHSAQALAWKKVNVEVIRKEWKQVKKQWVDWVFYNDYTIEETNEWNFSMTSGSNWEIGDTLKTKSEWEYEVRATYTWKNWKSYTSSTTIYVAWNEVTYWNAWNNTTTDLTADKSILKVWETANFTLKSPVASWKVFVAIEKDDWILDYFVQDITSSAPRISVPVKDSYYPNFYVKAFLIWKNGNDPLPVFKRALSVIKIVTDYKNIKVKITPEKNHYLPWDKVKLNIKTQDEAGNIVPNANWSVSVVDESLLALKWNPKKNPFAFFYDMKRYLWIETYISLFNLVEKLDVKDISDWEKWWAWEWQKWGNAKKKRWVFKDTAFWQADFTTDKNWIANITTEALPDNLTTWVIESVASTADDTKIWIWEATIVTSKKVMINENTPRFLWSNDTITFSPVIFNKTWKNGTFKITAQGDNLRITNPIQEIKINNWDQKTINLSAKVADLGTIQSDSTLARITIKAVSEDAQDEDTVERYLPIVPTSTLETVATVWKTDAVSFLEKIDLTNVVLSSAKLVIRYAPTLLSNITSGMEFLSQFPYWCIEQKQSAILPNVYLKKLYNSIGLPFDLTKKMVKTFVDSETWNKEISVDELIKNYIAESQNFQKNSWGFLYWSDDMFSYADFHLTSTVLKWFSEIRSIWYTLNDASVKNALAYIKTRFYANQIEWCTPMESNNFCKYPETQRLEAIDAILSIEWDNYEAYKMWKLLDFKTEELSTKVEKLAVIWKLLKNKSLSESEKKELENIWTQWWNNILSDYLVYNPRGAFLGKDEQYSRVKNTSEFIWALSEFWFDKFKDVSQITDNMNKWVISQKKEWKFGSTDDTNSVVRNAAKYIVASQELKDVNMNIVLNLNNEKIATTQVDDKNKLEVFEKIISWDKLRQQNDFTINKTWNWKVYYDLALSYYLPSASVKPRDEWFYLDQVYFDYNEYRKIETLKKAEYAKYMNWEIDHKNLKYPKNVVEYLNPVAKIKVWQLLVSYNKIATSETRDQVAFEWFIPAWSELINTNLDTENKSLKFENFFTRSEFRDDRFFWFANNMQPWIYEFNYILRATHKWAFNLQPSRVSEFYNTEVFGRNGWKLINVEE
ncbi:MAG: hypothetical protein ACD_3C00105G0018 [uncultured bacterium (gcode 4)]|uniref:Alpha-2-macroglobulin domain-containing protein n=1 Tax=uncultured bacterium (gcode 4) TaxID=1234023 RepID=K2GXG3_9BACT|nr:MAG: hypothetical protein ACD_3C00105G0018 [uncultured bacterium (gcode 4)]